MSLLMMLAKVLCFLGFATYVWLLVLAFKRSAGWGLAVLFLSPIAAIIFAIKNWDESKKPFLISTGCTVSAIAIFVFVIGSMGGYDMYKLARATENGEITDEQAAEFFDKTLSKWEDSSLLDADEKADVREIRKAFDAGLRSESEFNEALNQKHKKAASGERRSASGSGTRPLAIADDDSTQDQPVNVEEWYVAPRQAGYSSISLRDAARYVGEPIRIVEKDGLKHKGILAEANRNAILVERHVSGGSVTLEIARSQIRSLEVYYN